MNKHHREIVKLYSLYRGNYSSKHDENYIGTSKFSYPISTPESLDLWLDKVRGWTEVETQQTPLRPQIGEVEVK